MLVLCKLTVFLSTFLRSNCSAAAAATPQPWPGGGLEKIDILNVFRIFGAFLKRFHAFSDVFGHRVFFSKRRKVHSRKSNTNYH